MRRFAILFATEFKAWLRDPVTALGGFIPSIMILIAFGLLFGGRLAFQVAVVNHDQGPYGALLRETFDEVLSPFGTPYYDVPNLSEEAVWQAYAAQRIDGVWVIPADFSTRLEAGQNPAVEMYFSNYNDDRAKNHRIYAAEILWRFYIKIGMPAPPLALAEEYPRPEMVEWFPVIGVGVVLMATTLGGMVNIFMLTLKEQLAQVTLEFGLAPRSLAWALIPKTLLALLMGLLTGTAMLGLLALWSGDWPGRYLPAVWLLAGLVTLFWIPLTLLLGMRIRNQMAGAIIAILTGMTVFFTAGGLSLVRPHKAEVLWFSWLFPNIYAVDPLRDLILFHTWPPDWTPVLLTVLGFALLSLVVGLTLTARWLRRLG